jgi:hypothetical protein
MKKMFPFLFVLLLVHTVQAQDTLPQFSLRNVGNERIVVGWVNAYPVVKQISIQRSFDSVNFKTILSVADPAAVQNGYVDAKAPNDHMYYRLFIMLDSGQYLFSRTKRPILDTANAQTVALPDAGAVPGKPGDNPVANVIKVPDYVPSVYVYTNKDGYLFINLPDAEQKKYRIKFYDETGSLLFELKHIKEQALTLDKANFLHAGWFRFELFNEEKLVEQNKFFLARDF